MPQTDGVPSSQVRRSAPVGAALLVLVAAGCSSSDPDRVGTGVTPTAVASDSSSSAPAPSTTSAVATPALPSGVPAAATSVSTGLPLPWSLVPLPSEGAVSGTGWLLSLRDEARVVHLSPEGDASPVATTGPDGTVPGTTPLGEGGLLGLALREDAGSTWLYAYQTVGGQSSPTNQVVRMPLSGTEPAALQLGDPEVLLEGIPASSRHNGGRLAFGPDDLLYVTTGDAGDTALSQDASSLGGKILRLTPEGAPAPGNPTEGSPVWSLGHRNVQGIGWAADGRMFASEFGQNTFDELNLIEPGGNYGWPVIEGAAGAGGEAGFVDPLVTWSTEDASPSGLAVTADAVYLAALRGARLWRVPLVDGPEAVGPPEAYATGEFGRLRDVLVDGREEQPSLLVLTNNVGRDPRPDDDQLLRFPLG